MSWVWIKTIGLLLLLLFMLAAFPAAHASTPMTVTGTIPNSTFTFTPTNIRSADGNTIIIAIETGTDTGDIVGTWSAIATVIIHADGSANFHAEGTETGSILGSGVGTFSWSDSGTNAPDGTDSGRFVITNGAGGLTGIHGVISFHTPSPGADDVYSGQVHFDP